MQHNTCQDSCLNTMQLPTVLFVPMMTVLALVGNIYCMPTIVNDVESRHNSGAVLSELLRVLVEERARRESQVSVHCVETIHTYSMQASIDRFMTIDQRFSNDPCGRQNAFMQHLEVLCKKMNR